MILTHGVIYHKAQNPGELLLQNRTTAPQTDGAQKTARVPTTAPSLPVPGAEALGPTEQASPLPRPAPLEVDGSGSRKTISARDAYSAVVSVTC